MRTEEDVEVREHAAWEKQVRAETDGMDEATGRVKADWKQESYVLSDHSAPGSEDEAWTERTFKRQGYHFAVLHPETGKPVSRKSAAAELAKSASSAAG